MTFVHWFGWLVALGVGLGWWLDHRGLKGAISDSKDAFNRVQSEAQRLRDKVK